MGVKAVLVSHSHWDREWYREFQQFRAHLVDLVDFVLDQISVPGEMELAAEGVEDTDATPPFPDATALISSFTYSSSSSCASRARSERARLFLRRCVCALLLLITVLNIATMTTHNRNQAHTNTHTHT